MEQLNTQIPSFQFPNVQNIISNAIKDATEIKPFGGGVGTGDSSKGFDQDVLDD